MVRRSVLPVIGTLLVLLCALDAAGLKKVVRRPRMTTTAERGLVRRADLVRGIILAPWMATTCSSGRARRELDRQLFSGSIAAARGLPEELGASLLRNGEVILHTKEIGEALEAAHAGDAISINPGVYSEQLFIKTPVSISASGEG